MADTAIQAEVTAIAPTQDQGPLAMMAVAVARGSSVDELKILQELCLRHEANEARKAFASAMVEFKSQAPAIVKDKLVKHSGASYSHASLGEAALAISAAMAKVGLSASWTVDQPSSDAVIVACVVTHADGHSESVTMRAPPDSSGRKNQVQEIASTVTYLQRYTLLAAAGIAATDDDDGRSAYKRQSENPAPQSKANKQKAKDPAPEQPPALRGPMTDEQSAHLDLIILDDGMPERVRTAVQTAMRRNDRDKPLSAHQAQKMIDRAKAVWSEKYGSEWNAQPDGDGCQHAHLNEKGRCMACGERVPGADIE